MQLASPQRFRRRLRRGREIGGVLQAVVFQLENVQAGFVALDQFVVGEGVEAIGLFAFVAILNVVAGDEVVEVRLLEGVMVKHLTDVKSVKLLILRYLSLISRRYKNLGAEEGTQLSGLLQVLENMQDVCANDSLQGCSLTI